MRKVNSNVKTGFFRTTSFLFICLLFSFPDILNADPLDNWHKRSNTLYGVAYGSNTFVAVGTSGTVMTSLDGSSWAFSATMTSITLHGVAYGNNIFVAVGEYGTLITSRNGSSWTGRVSGTSNDLYGVAYGNSIFVVVGEAGTILTSTDGITWTARNSWTSNTLSGLTYGSNSNSRFGLVYG